MPFHITSRPEIIFAVTAILLPFSLCCLLFDYVDSLRCCRLPLPLISPPLDADKL